MFQWGVMRETAVGVANAEIYEFLVKPFTAPSLGATREVREDLGKNPWSIIYVQPQHFGWDPDKHNKFHSNASFKYHFHITNRGKNSPL